MELITKISKLNRIPQLLNKKREVELEERKKREDSSDRPPFPFNHRINVKREKSEPKGHYYSSREMETARARKAGIGRRLDVFA